MNLKAPIFIVLFLFFSAISYLRLDPDFGWHLQTGNYIRANGIPKFDPFTYTASDFEWIDHEWLNDVITSILNDAGGYFLIALFFGALWTAGLYLTSRRQYWPVLVIAALALAPYSGIRPIAWTLLFFAVLERILESKSNRIKFVLPLLFLFWASLHGGFFFGLAVLIGYFVLNKGKIKPLIVLASISATFINPYGLRLYEEIFRTLFDPALHSRIEEWFPLHLEYESMIYIILFAAVFLATEKRWNRKLFSLPGLTFVMALSSSRHLPLFVISSLRYFENYYAKLIKEIPKKLGRERMYVKNFLILSVLFAVSAGLYQVFTPFKDRESTYPKAAVEYLTQNPCEGNLFNSYGFGGYLIWKLPEQKVYIDGRMPSWRKDGMDYFVNYSRVFNDKEFRIEEFARYDIKCVLIKPDRLDEMLVSEGWTQVMKDGAAVLLIKNQN